MISNGANQKTGILCQDYTSILDTIRYYTIFYSDYSNLLILDDTSDAHGSFNNSYCRYNG